MILEHLTLRNSGLYRGEQTFDLTPLPAARNAGMRPIVLFGGVNGAGKTTLLDAVQLALYGPRARCSKRTDLAFEEFLRQSIHHGVIGSDGAGVSLSFRYASGGEEHVYDVSRSWSVPCGTPSPRGERGVSRKVREELQVSLDGLPDRWHSEHWGQLVEDFFPLEVSRLFFFDAEKIRSLAELRREAENLRDRRSRLAREVKEIDRDQAITPEDEGIARFLERLRASTERRTTLNEEAK